MERINAIKTLREIGEIIAKEIKRGLIISILLLLSSTLHIRAAEPLSGAGVSQKLMSAVKKAHKKAKRNTEKEKKRQYEKDLYNLSHLIYAEAGDERYPDKMRYYTGSVVLNRVASNRYPDTIEAVIFQSGQYQCTWVGTFYNKPSKRCIEIAKDLLKSGSVLPKKVVYQAGFTQGEGIYDQVGPEYYCY